MDALEALLNPIARVLNRNIRSQTPARELCAELEGTTIAIRVRSTGLAAAFVVHEDALELTTSELVDADVVISGSLLTLARIASESGERALRDGDLELTGDVESAQGFQKLLKLARPELEEELAGVVGDVVAHRIGGMARGLGRWAREARSTMGSNLREYLQEESRDVPSRYEFGRFTHDVRRLRDDLDRLEARIDRLQERR